jgi:hypothetical protein
MNFILLIEPDQKECVVFLDTVGTLEECHSVIINYAEEFDPEDIFKIASLLALYGEKSINALKDAMNET